MNFTKSKYIEYVKCAKAAWLTRYKPETRVRSEADIQSLEEGHVIGDIAKGYFGSFVEATACRPDGSLDISQMNENTKKFIRAGEKNICEAAFSFNGLYCAVDLLHREKDGYAIYEVKKSTSVKDIHIVDVSFQKYVLEGCGIKVVGTYLMHLNGDFVREGAIDPKKLLLIEDIGAAVSEEQKNVERILSEAESYLAAGSEPEMEITCNCDSCDYFEHCSSFLPKPNVFDSHYSSFNKKLECYNNGILTLDQVMDAEEKMFLKKHPLAVAVADGSIYVEKDNIREFLGTLSYPLYFLDFETMTSLVPAYDGIKTNQQVTFQYSLHYVEKEGDMPLHKEFLAESGTDTRRAVAERLVADIPKDVCVLAYNMSFECGRIQELADTFPDLAEHLLAIKNNIKDLIVPFRKKYCYTRAMEGSASIKYVLPALFPNEPRLNYHNLEGVHNGGEAMSIFPQIATMPPEQAENARKWLLAYCELDTFAMVMVWQRLKELVAG